MSLANNKLGNFKMAIQGCTKALAIDDKAVKALYIRSQAHQSEKDLQEAMNDIKAAIKLSPNDKTFRALFEKIKKAR